MVLESSYRGAQAKQIRTVKCAGEKPVKAVHRTTHKTGVKIALAVAATALPGERSVVRRALGEDEIMARGGTVLVSVPGTVGAVIVAIV